MYHQGTETANDAVAGREVVGGQQLLIVLGHLGRHRQHHLGQIVAVVGHHVGIGIASDVQHHVVIPRIAVVTVLVPLAAVLMNLHIAHPQRAADAQLGVEEVGTGVAIVQARVDDLHQLAVGGA